MRRSYFTFIACLSLAISCGGRVDDTDDTDAEARDGSGGTGEAGASPPLGGEELGACREGFVPGSDDRPCNWVVGGRCYELKLEACACACPTDAPSTCVSGFPRDDGRVEVRCF